MDRSIKTTGRSTVNFKTQWENKMTQSQNCPIHVRIPPIEENSKLPSVSNKLKVIIFLNITKVGGGNG